jgi:hypothetical protein
MSASTMHSIFKIISGSIVEEHDHVHGDPDTAEAAIMNLRHALPPFSRQELEFVLDKRLQAMPTNRDPRQGWIVWQAQLYTEETLARCLHTWHLERRNKVSEHEWAEYTDAYERTEMARTFGMMIACSVTDRLLTRLLQHSREDEPEAGNDASPNDENGSETTPEHLAPSATFLELPVELQSSILQHCLNFAMPSCESWKEEFNMGYLPRRHIVNILNLAHAMTPLLRDELIKLMDRRWDQTPDVCPPDPRCMDRMVLSKCLTLWSLQDDGIDGWDAWSRDIARWADQNLPLSYGKSRGPTASYASDSSASAGSQHDSRMTSIASVGGPDWYTAESISSTPLTAEERLVVCD